MLAGDLRRLSCLAICIMLLFQKTVSIFLDHKGLRDEPDIEGRTAFIWAAGKGADDVVKVFIQHKVDMGLADKTGGTGM